MKAKRNIGQEILEGLDEIEAQQAGEKKLKSTRMTASSEKN